MRKLTRTVERFIQREVLPSFVSLAVLLLALAMYLVVSLLGLKIPGFDAGQVATTILISSLSSIALFLYFLYRHSLSSSKYESALKSIEGLDLPGLKIVPTSMTETGSDNLRVATYAMSLARRSIVSMSVLSAPVPKSGAITEAEDTVARDVFRSMERGDKRLGNDFVFKRIVSLQDADERLFSDYLQARRSRVFTRGKFESKVYPIQTREQDPALVRFPNFIVVDSRYLFLTLRQAAPGSGDPHSRGFFIVDEDIASAFASYFEYIWCNHCR